MQTLYLADCERLGVISRSKGLLSGWEEVEVCEQSSNGFSDTGAMPPYLHPRPSLKLPKWE